MPEPYGFRTHSYFGGQGLSCLPPHGIAVGVGVAVGVPMQSPPQGPFGGHVTVGVHVERAGQPEAPTVQGTKVGPGGVGVAMHSPPQACVCVQSCPPGQSLAPTTHGWVSGGAVVDEGITGLVVMQAPPQGPGPQVCVGVQVDPVGQPRRSPIVQPINGGTWADGVHTPPQVDVWVHVDPVGHGTPPR